MLLSFAAIAVGLALLVWSAGKFVEGSAATAGYFGMPPLLIGMVVVGFGTSAPEMVVSALAATQGNPGLALGNAYGSNITNIALILGITALLSPIAVHSQAWSIRQGMTQKSDALGAEIAEEMSHRAMPLRKAVLWLIVGLLLLIVSSRILVWGAVELALGFGVSDLIIGLTIVAVGTSLPELASSVIAARKGEHDIALGNILGSNLFNTLAVVGIAGTISPMVVAPEVFYRDIAVMSALTLSLFVLGYGFRGPGRINRVEGGFLLACFIGYTAYLISTTFTS